MNRRTLLLVLAASILSCPLFLSSCAGTLSVDDGLADDDATSDDDDDASDDDDTTTDDDATDDDDATSDDDATGDDDVDMSTWVGSRVVVLDFSEYAEEYAGKVDCEAPYEMNGIEATGTYQDLCPVCAFIYQVNHDPDPADQAEECLSQAYITAANFDALYGIQMAGETDFILWRNDGGGGSLDVYGSGSIDGAEFVFETDAGDNGWYVWWVEGEGTFGG